MNDIKKMKHGLEDATDYESRPPKTIVKEDAHIDGETQRALRKIRYYSLACNIPIADLTAEDYAKIGVREPHFGIYDLTTPDIKDMAHLMMAEMDIQNYEYALRLARTAMAELDWEGPGLIYRKLSWIMRHYCATRYPRLSEDAGLEGFQILKNMSDDKLCNI